VKVAKEVLARPAIEAWDRDDRRLRFVDLTDVEIARAKKLTLEPGARALVESDRGPLVATFARGDVEHTVVAFDPHDSSWPLRATWPIFIRNVVLAALEDEALGPSGPVRAGSVVALRCALDQDVQVTTPSGRTVTVARDRASARALFAETDEVGIYRARTATGELLFGVSVLDERESDVEPRAALELGARRIPPRASGASGERDVAVPFALAALVLVLLEGFAYHRRA
jgi:hypothetical protein